MHGTEEGKQESNKRAERERGCVVWCGLWSQWLCAVMRDFWGERVDFLCVCDVVCSQEV